MAASPGFAPGPPVSETGALLVMPRGSVPGEPQHDRQRLVAREGVAPSPRRSKSPVPVCGGFGSAKVVLAAGFAPALATFSTSCLCWLGYASNGGMPWTCTTLPGCRGAHCLADRPGALVRLTFLETGPRGRSCTCNLPVLSGTPLAGWATRGANGTPGRTLTCITDVRSVALW